MATKTMLHLERLALIEGLHICVSASLDVVGMKNPSHRLMSRRLDLGGQPVKSNQG